ncbi:MAG: alpha/beta hydrolase [Dehalococcoidales bacterium]
MMTEIIVMIHGMWGGGWNWENFQQFFGGKGYHCITPTLRLHDVDPKAPPHPQLGTTSLLDYVEDLEKDIRKLDTLPILMGHSMGGLLAQILGSRGLAKALVLLAPAPPSPLGIMALKPSVIRGFLSPLLRWGFWRKPMRQTFAEAAYSTMNLLTEKEQKRLYDRYVYESGRAACEIGFWFLDQKRAAQVDESKVTCPMLIIEGSQDRIMPASVVRKTARKYKAVATYRELPNHAHWLIVEPGWQEIAEDIADWLNQVLTKADESTANKAKGKRKHKHGAE